jgi:hypothetical protein
VEEMKIKKVTDPEFSRYGRVIDGYDFSKLIKAMEHTPLPEDVIYEPSIEELEATDVAIDLKMRVYGELPIQIGYCNGHNTGISQKFRSECRSDRYHSASGSRAGYRTGFYI